MHRNGKSLYDSTVGGGSFFRPDGSAAVGPRRRAVVASGLGVAVDDDGQLLGGVKADDVLAAWRSSVECRSWGSR